MADDAEGLLQDRWLYMARDERNPSRQAFWYLRDSDSDYQLKVIARGTFFDAQRDNFILGRFTALEEAQRYVEADAERKPPRKRSIKRPP